MSPMSEPSPDELFIEDVRAVLVHLERLDAAGVEGVSQACRDLVAAFERLEKEVVDDN